MTVDDLAAVWGIDSANPLRLVGDRGSTCSNIKADRARGHRPTAGNLDPSMANFALMTLLNSDSTAKGLVPGRGEQRVLLRSERLHEEHHAERAVALYR